MFQESVVQPTAWSNNTTVTVSCCPQLVLPKAGGSPRTPQCVTDQEINRFSVPVH